MEHLNHRAALPGLSRTRCESAVKRRQPGIADGWRDGLRGQRRSWSAKRFMGIAL